MVVARNACGAADALPGGGVEQFTVGAAGGHVGEEVEQVAATQPTPVDVEQVDDESRHEAFDQTRSGPPVPLDPGNVEVVLDESCVRSLRRPQHGHPTERRAGAAGVEHGPDGEPDFVVGVGGGDHLDGGRLCQWRDDGRQLRTRPTGLERFRNREQFGVGCLVAGDAQDDVDVGDSAEPADQPQLASAQLLREVHDRVGELAGHGVLRRELGLLEEVAFVVPARLGAGVS